MNAILQPDQCSALVLGGARSGKSTYAEAMVLACGDTPHYVATSPVLDPEMKTRIERHKQRRGSHWTLIEEQTEIQEAILESQSSSSAILVDCLTLWLSNLMHHGRDIEVEAAKLSDVIQNLKVPLILVSNEVGMGIVPENTLAREFRDHQGRLNQNIASVVDRVDFIAAGLPIILKPQG